MAMHSDNDYMITEEASVGYQKRTLIDHVNLHVKKGEILTLIGPNGVGKSTILKSIIRQHSLIAGTVSVVGIELGKSNLSGTGDLGVGRTNLLSGYPL